MFDYGSQPPNTRPARTAGRLGGTSSVQGVSYPSPFFDLAHTYLPPTVRQMFRWCRYYYLTNPLINSVVNKMAEYPITDLVIDTDNKGLRDKWETLFEDDIQLRPSLLDTGLFYNCYGNSPISISFPFVKWLTCAHCGHKVEAKKAKYRFRSYKFYLTCKKCGNTADAEAEDITIQSPHGIRLILWNPEDLDLQYNELTGKTIYYYTLPTHTRNAITMGKREIIEDLPQLFIQSAKEGKSVVLSPDNIFHLRRPSVLTGRHDRGWGIPLMLPVLKDTFYLQVMKKAQEAVLVERIVPLTTIFPQAGSGTSDPYCVSHDTLVETREGMKPAGEVGSGDYVRTHVGKWKIVEEAVDRPVEDREDVFEITAASLTAFPFQVSEGHPILAAKRPVGHKWKGYADLPEPEWVKAKDLSEGDFVCYPTSRPTWSSLSLDLAGYNPERAATEKYIYRRLDQESAEIYEFFEAEGIPEFSRKGLPKDYAPLGAFLEKNGWSRAHYENARASIKADGIDRIPRYLPVTEDLAFLIGLYAAEGCPRGPIATYTLGADEDPLIDQLNRSLAALGFDPALVSDPRSGAVTCSIEDVLLSSVLFSCGRGAQNKKLPRFITEAPEPVAIRALDALLRGDGCDFSTDTRRIGLKTVSPQLAVDARGILLSLGVLPTTQRSVPLEEEIAKLPYYQVNVNGSQADHLSYLLKRGPAAAPGHSRCGFIRDGYAYMRIRSLRPVESVTVVRGFQVRGDKSFCVAGVATHNTSINLTDWKNNINREIQRWRLDRNYIPVLPLPIGHQVIGGDGRALLMSQEIRVWSEHIVAGMGVPQEFVFGGLQWSGSNVSLRMLENQFLRYLSSLSRFIRSFLIPKIAAHLDWPEVGIRFKPFKMADDLQRKAFYAQLNSTSKVSDTTLLQDCDLNPEEENELMRKETKNRMEAVKDQQIAEAIIQGEVGVIQAKYQAKAMAAQQQEQMQAQQGMAGTAPGEPGEDVGSQPVPAGPMPGPQTQAPQPGAPGDPIAMMVERLRSVSPQAQNQVLQRIAEQNPQLAQQVFNKLRGTGGSAGGSATPLPTQLPPRRGPETALI